MNTNVITVPSMVGVADCITESLSVDVEAVPTAGGGKWQNYNARNIRAMVTGEAYLTPANRDTLQEGSKVVVNLPSALLEGIVVQTTDRADAIGRAIRSYEVVTTRTRLPQKDKLFALFVPRWQTEQNTIMRDYVTGNDMVLGGAYVWEQDGSITFPQSAAAYAQSAEFEPVERSQFTILANRTANTSGVAGYGGTGYKLVWNIPNRLACEIVDYIYNSQLAVMVGGRFNYDLTLLQGWVVMTDNRYNDEVIVAGTGRNTWSQHVINVYQTPNRIYQLWSNVSCIAVWRERLTDTEIKQAQYYLTQTNDARDFTS